MLWDRFAVLRDSLGMAVPRMARVPSRAPGIFVSVLLSPGSFAP
jgi:hypothetical protein